MVGAAAVTFNVASTIYNDGIYVNSYIHIHLVKLLLSIPVCQALNLQSIDEGIELLGVEAALKIGTCGPWKFSGLQTLRCDPGSGSVPTKALEPFAGFVGEEKEMAGSGVLMEDIEDDAVETTEGTA